MMAEAGANQTPDAPLGLRSLLGVLSSCGSTLLHLAVVTPRGGVTVLVVYKILNNTPSWFYRRLRLVERNRSNVKNNFFRSCRYNFDHIDPKNLNDRCLY